MKNKLLLFKHILLFVLVLSISKGFAQGLGDITPMHTFLQKNSDTSILLEYNYSTIHTPEYFILSKKGDTISAYTYKVLPSIDKRIIVPHNIGYKIFKRNNFDIYNTVVDINIYFNPKYLSQDSLNKFWKEVNIFRPWQIKDDSIDGEACPEYTSEKYISDLGGISLYLVTKDEIKKLYFYGPKYFEEKLCPGRQGRKAILELEKLFLTYFKE